MMPDMKIFIRELGCIAISLLVCIDFINSQASWNRSIDFNSEENYGMSVLEISDSVYIVAILSYREALPYGVLIGLDQNGSKLWNREIAYPDQAFHMSESFNVGNHIWSTGVLDQASSVQFRPIIIAHNFLGEEQWRKTYDFDSYNVNFKRGIRQVNEHTAIAFFNGYYIDGSSKYIHRHGYLLIDSLGNEISRHWFPSQFDINLPFDIVPFPGGGYMQSILEIAESPGVPFEHSLEIKRLDDTFGIIWHKTLPCEERGSGKFAFDSKKNIYVTWTEDPLIPGECSPWASPAIFSYDSLGNFRWKHVFDDNPRQRILGNLVTTSEGNIVVCGLDEPGFDPLQWGWIVSVDTSGSLLWDRKYTIKDIPREFGGFFGDIKESSDGKLLVLGSIHDKYPFESAAARDNAWLIKAELDGCIEGHECEEYSMLTSIKNGDFNQIKFKIYPNPSIDEINIETFIEDQYIIDIIDISGINILSTAGFGNKFTVKINKLLPGVYFLRLSSKVRTIIQEIAVMK